MVNERENRDRKGEEHDTYMGGRELDRKIKVHCCVRRYNNSTCTTRGEKGLHCIPVRFDVYNVLTKGLRRLHGVRFGGPVDR